MDFRTLAERAGISLSEYQIGVVRRHASASMQTQMQQRDCREYTSLGGSVMRCAFAVYMYLECGIRDKDELSRRLNSSRQHLTASLCNEYSLEDYVIVGSSEKSRSKYQDIAQRLVAATYITHGFLKAYDLLKPFFRDVPLHSDGLYKNLVQQYAQERHVAFSYQVIETVGPANAPRITCELRVGNEIMLGTAIGKKKAEIEAAKRFAHRHGITPPAGGVKQRQCKSSSVQTITKARARDLSRARGILGIDNDCVSSNQLDVILTHISFAADHPGVESNETLHMVGSTVLDLLVNDHIYHDYTVEHTSVRELVTLVTSDDRIGMVAPDGIISALRVGRSFNNKIAINAARVKADVFKALLAQLWINYRQTTETSYGVAAHQLVAGIIEALEDEPLLNYTSLLQELVQANGYRMQSKARSASGPANKPICTVDLVISTGNDTFRASGTSTSKTRAFSDAAKRILPMATDRSPNNATSKAIRALLVTGGRLVRKNGVVPSAAEVTIGGDSNEISAEEAHEVHGALDVPPADDQWANGDQPHRQQGPVPNEQVPVSAADSNKNHSRVGLEEARTDVIEEAKDRSEAGNTDESAQSILRGADDSGCETAIQKPMVPRLYVCIDSYDCERRGHNTTTGTWELRDLEGNTLHLETCHCEDCGVDLADYMSYRALRDSRGPLLGDYAIVQRWRAGRIDRDIPDDVPVLAMLGYGVSNAIGLTDEQRQLILSNSFEWGTLQRDKAVARLRHLCELTGDVESLGTARSKWRKDLVWILERRT